MKMYLLTYLHYVVGVLSCAFKGRGIIHINENHLDLILTYQHEQMVLIQFLTVASLKLKALDLWKKLYRYALGLDCAPSVKKFKSV